MIEAVLFDFGGVILTSPFETFADYEIETGLPQDTIRTLNSTNPDTNAWAKFERFFFCMCPFVLYQFI